MPRDIGSKAERLAFVRETRSSQQEPAGANIVAFRSRDRVELRSPGTPASTPRVKNLKDFESRKHHDEVRNRSVPVGSTFGATVRDSEILQRYITWVKF